jgi:hypothetical protein
MATSITSSFYCDCCWTTRSATAERPTEARELRNKQQDFAFHFNPKLSNASLSAFAACNFLFIQINVLLVSPSRAGKSNIA